MAAPARDPRPGVDGATTLAATLGTWLLLELLRLWSPSVAFVLGRASSTPPLQLGAFALAPFVLVFGVAPLVRRVGARSVLRAGGVVLVVARIVAQAADGGQLLLWSTTVGSLAALAWLVAAAAGGLARAPLATGLAAGLALDTVVEVLLGGGSLGWTDGVGWALLLPLLGLFVAALGRARPAAMLLSTAARAWLLLGPVLALHLTLGGLPRGLVAATTGRVVGGRSQTLVAFGTAAIAVGAAALGTRYALEARAGRRGRWTLPLVALAAVAATVVLAGQPAVVVAQAVLVLLLAVACAVLTTTTGRATPVQHALGAAGGLLLLFLLATSSFATHDLSARVWHGASSLVAGAGLAVGLAWAGGRGTSVPAPRAPGPARSALAVAGVALLVAGGFAVSTRVPDTTAATGFPVRVGLANLHMGFDTHGRYVADEQAAVLAAQAVDVVVLNEVDRGRALTGGQDVLTDLAASLELPYVFAPAADDLRGNAILSRYPVVRTGHERLPDSGGSMPRSVVWVVLEVGEGRELAVVGTHLHHRADDASSRLPQARRVAEIATELAVGGRPVVVAGDLDATPGSPEIAPIEDRFRSAARGRPPPTYPSWAPERTLDHVLVSPDLRTDDVEALPSQVSDHLFLVVSVEPA